MMDDLFSYVPAPKAPDFDGVTYDRTLDRERLKKQLAKVKQLLSDHQWHGSREIAEYAGSDWGSISARVRDLRKAKFGGFIIERKRSGDPTRGKHIYRLVPPTSALGPCGPMKGAE